MEIRTKQFIEEEEADQFALELLMPAYMVYDISKRYEIGLRDYDSFAKIFGVSYTHARKRLQQLGFVIS